MERAAWLERRFGARIEWRPFDLHPEYPPEGIPRSELERRYGSGFGARLGALFEENGLPHAERLDKVPNSRGALIVAELARETGVFHQLHPRLFEAYWVRGRDIGDRQVLIEEGAAVGLEESQILDALDDSGYVERIKDQTAAALELGAGGVPAWLLDDRFLVPGAQPYELFEQVMDRLGHPPSENGDPHE